MRRRADVARTRPVSVAQSRPKRRRADDRVRGEPAAGRPTKPVVRRLTSGPRGSACGSSGLCSCPARAARSLSAWRSGHAPAAGQTSEASLKRSWDPRRPAYKRSHPVKAAAGPPKLQARAACGGHRVLLREHGAVWPECCCASDSEASPRRLRSLGTPGIAAVSPGSRLAAGSDLDTNRRIRRFVYRRAPCRSAPTSSKRLWRSSTSTWPGTPWWRNRASCRIR